MAQLYVVLTWRPCTKMSSSGDPALISVGLYSGMELPGQRMHTHLSRDCQESFPEWLSNGVLYSDEFLKEGKKCKERIRDSKRTCYAKMGTVKDRNGMD